MWTIPSGEATASDDETIGRSGGDLYSCKNGLPSHVCSYYYANGDECVFFSLVGGRFPWCLYIGGKP